MEELVRSWSEDIAATRFLYGDAATVPETVSRTGHVVLPGANEDELETMEERLELHLPPSYRAFLSISNGSSAPTAGGSHLFSVSSVTHPFLESIDDLYIESAASLGLRDFGRSAMDTIYRPTSEAEYLSATRSEAAPGLFKAGHVYYSLLIGRSTPGWVFLNPLVADAVGEWEVVVVYTDESFRYSSFGAWLAAEAEKAARELWRGRYEELAHLCANDPDIGSLSILAAHAQNNRAAHELLSDIANGPGDDPSLVSFAASLLDQLTRGSVTESQGDPKRVRPFADVDLASTAEPMRTLIKAEIDAFEHLEAANEASDNTEAIEEIVQSANSLTPYGIYRLAEFDEPAGWDALDLFASQQSPMSWMSLLVAARTRSPHLPERARSATKSENDAVAAAGRLALELHPEDAAGQVLLDQWSKGSSAALRSLARRGDNRILDACLTNLESSDSETAIVASEALRDLRHPASVDALVEFVATTRNTEALVIAAHCLAMMQVREAAGALRDRADTSMDELVGDLLSRWADQLLSSSD